MIIAKGEELLLYSFGENHPFNNSRIKAFFDNLIEIPNHLITKPHIAERKEIELFHIKEYVDFVIKSSEKGVGFIDYGDTPSFRGVYEASSWVVGTTLNLLKLINSGKGKMAFNPMGGLHHAMRGRAGGFCVFNDAGVAIEYLLKNGLERVLYVDIDAHHGDGIYYPFEDNPAVYIWDVHEDGHFLYPGTGFAGEKGKGKAYGTKVNVPLPPDSGDEELLAHISSLEELAKRSQPEWVILQAGVDGLVGDPLTHLKYSFDGYAKIIEIVKEIACFYASNRLLVLGGGGYNISNVSQGWLRLVKILNGG